MPRYILEIEISNKSGKSVKEFESSVPFPEFDKTSRWEDEQGKSWPIKLEERLLTETDGDLIHRTKVSVYAELFDFAALNRVLG